MKLALVFNALFLAQYVGASSFISNLFGNAGEQGCGAKTVEELEDEALTFLENAEEMLGLASPSPDSFSRADSRALLKNEGKRVHDCLSLILPDHKGVLAADRKDIPVISTLYYRTLARLIDPKDVDTICNMALAEQYNCPVFPQLPGPAPSEENGPDRRRGKRRLGTPAVPDLTRVLSPSYISWATRTGVLFMVGAVSIDDPSKLIEPVDSNIIYECFQVPLTFIRATSFLRNTEQTKQTLDALCAGASSFAVSTGIEINPGEFCKLVPEAIDTAVSWLQSVGDQIEVYIENINTHNEVIRKARESASVLDVQTLVTELV